MSAGSSLYLTLLFAALRCKAGSEQRFLHLRGVPFYARDSTMTRSIRACDGKDHKMTASNHGRSYDKPMARKREREQLRKTMLAAGSSIEQIAAEIGRRFRERPRAAFRYAHGMTQQDVADAYNALADVTGRAAMTAKRISAFECWPSGNVERPSVYVLDVLARVFATSMHNLLDKQDYDHLPEKDRRLLTREQAPPVLSSPPTLAASLRITPPPTNGLVLSSYSGNQALPSPEGCGGVSLLRGEGVVYLTPGRLCPDDINREEDIIMAAAHESSEHAGLAESASLGATTLEQLHEDVVRIAHDYDQGPLLLVFGEIVRVRNRAYRLLERIRRPTQLKDLYVIAGQLCGLLAYASSDLGYHAAGAEQARAAFAYAEIAKHNELRVWARGIQALMAYYSGRLREAVDLAQSGQEYSPSGTALARLRSYEAQAWSSVGNVADAARAIDTASRARDQAEDSQDFPYHIGGVFAFPAAEQAGYMGEAYVNLRDGERAAHSAQQAVELFAASPAEQRCWCCEPLAHANLATARLMQGELGGAREALAPIFALPAQQRLAPMIQRLADMRHRLAQQPYRDAPEARDLGDQIEDFAITTATSQLPTNPS
jgi:hypothetical protein